MSGDPERIRHKRWAWFRQYNGVPYHPKWTSVAELARVRKEVVVVVVACIEDAANKGTPRGNAEEFSFAECADLMAYERRPTWPPNLSSSRGGMPGHCSASQHPSGPRN